MEALGTTAVLVPSLFLSSFRSPSFNLLTRAEKERERMEWDRKGSERAGEVRANEQIGSGFTPSRERPSEERDYGLTILLHCVTICPSFSPQARESLSPTTTDSLHCSFGGICAGVGRRHPTSDLVPCESARVREESERNKIDPLEERKEGRGKRPNKKEGFQAKRQRRPAERAGANPPSLLLASLGGVGNSRRWLTGENEK